MDAQKAVSDFCPKTAKTASLCPSKRWGKAAKPARGGGKPATPQASVKI